MLKETKDYLLEFGKRIRAIRKKLGLSQKEFADAAKVVPSYLSNIENGKGNPTYEFLLRLFRKYDINMEYLFSGAGAIFKSKAGKDDEEFPLLNLDMPKPNNLNTTRNLVWYMERSPMLRNSVLGFAARLFYDNEKHIVREVEETDLTISDTPNTDDN